ncbi:GAP family protein [Nonomuraea sp. MG754425]|uniref:GAP family protein n=1 Tax=Nonomuraea sp. MG754425 TaxID=2570319 RepID=UPI001F389CC3|nr:GAP family protein [Nonomuraea sp. MG754425]MCF6466826.1 GAP family protein [Nonomuraea sp. MG754425]
MGAVLGELLPLALAVSISPVPIMAVILMLLGPRASGLSMGFLVGWVVGIVGATAVVVVLTRTIGLSASPGEPSAAVSWVKLVLGLLMLGLAVKQWRSREQPGLPGWMKAIDKLTPVKAAGLGIALSGVNPKNLMMCAAAGVTIAQGAAHEILLLVVFTVLAACGIAVPVIVYAVAADRMRAPLDRLRNWLERNNATVMFVLLLVIGVVLSGKGLGGLLP